MDPCAKSVRVFDKLADAYRDKFLDQTLYHPSYRAFIELLPPGPVRVLDAACGPGIVSSFLLAHRPELQLLGVDLAPRMVELARAAVPGAAFAVHDCRRLGELKRRFDGILCAFGLPYLTWVEAEGFIRSAGAALEPGGVLYISTMLGRSEDSGVQRCSTGDEVHVHYHSEEQLLEAVRAAGFDIVQVERLASPSSAAIPTTDLILLARAGSKQTAQSAG